ncbi:MAG: hypothetical protein V3R82_03280 [Candidatus Hydrothermarchaeales archaeon]
MKHSEHSSCSKEEKARKSDETEQTRPHMGCSKDYGSAENTS